MKWLLMLALMIPIQVESLTIREALGMIESGNDDYAHGRRGEISRFQIMPRVWVEYTNDTNYFTWLNPDKAWTVAERILQDRHDEFVKNRRREPTPFELYVLWNAPHQLKQMNISPIVRERAQRFQNLIERKP